MTEALFFVDLSSVRSLVLPLRSFTHIKRAEIPKDCLRFEHQHKRLQLTNMPTHAFFIAGATGAQGGAVARHLLQAQCAVNAVARTPDSPTAKELVSLGVKIIQGDFDDEESLQVSIKDCQGVFLNLSPDFVDTNAELERAKRIISIAKAAGVKHIIYSSGFGANDPVQADSPLARVILPKHAIENEIRDSEFEFWTILRPGNFMANFLSPRVKMLPDLAGTGCFNTAFLRETKLPMLDHDDVGKFATEAFLCPQEFHRQEIEIASELLTVDDIIAALRAATGKDLKVVYLSENEIQYLAAKGSPTAWQVHLRKLASYVDLEKVRSWQIPLGTFVAFLEREKHGVDETYSGVP